MRRSLWILAAIAGLVLAAGITVAASRLSTVQVGLSSEPLRAGESLAPAPTPVKRPARPKRRRPAPTATPTPTPTATPTPVPTIDDHGGHRGHGGGHGSDD
jgi:hypothetical protein